jgi:hypothetical protein
MTRDEAIEKAKIHIQHAIESDNTHQGTYHAALSTAYSTLAAQLPIKYKLLPDDFNFNADDKGEQNG